MDAPDTTVLALGTSADRRPSETMIRRLLQALDPQLLTAAIGHWLVGRATTGTSSGRRAIAVDGKTLRGSRTTNAAARHVLAACDRDSGVVLADTDVDGHSNRITPVPALARPDRRPARHRDHRRRPAPSARARHLSRRTRRPLDLDCHGNQPHLYSQLAALPWQAAPDAARDTDRGHGRREIRTLRILTIASGIDFPHAAQAIQIPPLRHRLDEPKRFTTEATYAVTDLRPLSQARATDCWIRGHWHIENKIHWVRDVTYDEDRSQIRTGTGAKVMAALRNAAIGALRTAGITNIAAGTRHHARDST